MRSRRPFCERIARRYSLFMFMVEIHAASRWERARLTVVDTATAEMCGQVIYPAAVLKISRNPDAAQAFLDYLVSDVGDTVFEAVGFTPVA